MYKEVQVLDKCVDCPFSTWDEKAEQMVCPYQDGACAVADIDLLLSHMTYQK